MNNINCFRFQMLKVKNWNDGLKTIDKYYKIRKTEYRKLYTWILTDVGKFQSH